MAADFLPKRETSLLGWSRVFASKIEADPAQFGLTAQQASEYAAVHAEFAQALRLASEPDTRTSPIIARKNTAKRALQVKARQLAAIVRSTPGVTDVQKLSLGLSVERAGGRRPPIPPPAVAPGLKAEPLRGYRVRLRLYDFLVPGRRGKPRGCAGAIIFAHFGEFPPAEPAKWKYVGQTTRLVYEVDFVRWARTGPPLVPGMKVWLTACWWNPRGRRGPNCPPVYEHLQYGVSLKAA